MSDVAERFERDDGCVTFVPGSHRRGVGVGAGERETAVSDATCRNSPKKADPHSRGVR